MEQFSEQYAVDLLSIRSPEWVQTDFSKYDVVLHAAAIVHKREDKLNKQLFFNINKELTVDLARRARDAGAKQFIFLSTMAVYGTDGEIGRENLISKNTSPNPKTYYAASKLEAEVEIQKLANPEFIVTILRPPMIYGPSCPGNYGKLEKLAKVVPIFPLIENRRSMVHVDRLCELIKSYIENPLNEIFLPQDTSYINTSRLVKELGEKQGNKIILFRVPRLFLSLSAKCLPILNKLFGNLTYER